MTRTIVLLSILMGTVGCTRSDSPSRSGSAIPAVLNPNRPSPGRTITRKVDNARQRVERACAMSKALGLPQIGCAEAEAVLDLPRQAGAR